MLTQRDHKVRVVAMANLKAMCERQSGVCHRYCVSKVTANRVRVQYSNPDEYGNEHPVEAELPCFPSEWDGAENPTVVIHVLRTIGGDDETYQSFEALWDCPELYRAPESGKDVWRSKAEWEALRETVVPSK